MKMAALIIFIFTSLASFGGTPNCGSRSGVYMTAQKGEEEDGKCVDERPIVANVIIANDPANIFSGSINTININTLRPDGLDHTEMRHSNCQSVDDSCKVVSNPLVTADYSDFIMEFSKYNKMNRVYMSEDEAKAKDCGCLNNRFKADFGESLALKKKEEEEKIKKKILEAYGKKFLNDFSANLEDASFFLTKNGNMFGDQEKAKGIQCTDPNAYDEMIDRVCKSRGISDKAFINQRKNYYINSIGGTGKPFNERITEISDQIQSIAYPATTGPYAGQSYHRYEYDNSRMGYAHNDPQGKMIDHLVKQLVLTDDIIEQISSYMAFSSPVEALLKFLKANAAKPEFARKYKLDKSIMGDALTNPEKLSSSFRFLINTHPGFMNVMMDLVSFSKLRDEVRKKPEASVLDLLETNNNIIEDQMVRKCADLTISLANAVCTKDEELISKMDAQDLENLLHAENKGGLLDLPDGPDLHELLICENTKPADMENFENLANLYDPKLPARHSDFLERLQGVKLEDQKNPFAKALLGSMKDERFREKMGHAASMGMAIGTSVTPGGVVSTQAYAKAVSEGKAYSIGKPAMSKAEAQTYLKESNKYEAKRAAQKLLANKEKTSPVIKAPEIANTDATEVKAPQVQNQSQVMPGTQVAAPVSNQPARQQLSNYLNRNNKPEEVSTALSKVDDPTTEELNRLRSENLDLLKQTYAEESKRMESMQKRVDDLQTKISEDSQRAPASVASKPSAIEDDENDVISSNRVSASSPVASSKASQGPSPQTQGQPGDQREVANGRGKPSEVKAPSPIVNTASSSSLTVSEIPQDKINEEVQKLVDGTALDSTSLEEVKGKGLKVKFKVLENNVLVEKEILVKFESLDQKTRNLIELKFAKKNRDQQVSKLAVLKMLIGQHKR